MTESERANILDEPTHAGLLRETLDEEKETDEKLTNLSKGINTQALDGNPEAKQKRPEPARKQPKRNLPLLGR